MVRKPADNAPFGSFNDRFRDACLNVYGFKSLADVIPGIE
ncbi:integrase core domain-containing protein [Klebsiella electrica]|nr:transposase [Raoultella sp. Lac2]MXF97122.1 transposase [Raoultella sp. Lac1]